jgi:hypothetical protein
MVEVNQSRSLRLAVSASLAAASMLLASTALAGNLGRINAIGGTGVNAIGGTGVADAIGGTGKNAIGGTGFNAIGGTGVNAIGGTGVAAIGGTGVNAIGGTGINAIVGTGQDRFVGVALTIKGPVEKVDVAANTISVFGRQLAIPRSSGLIEKVASAMAAGSTVEVAVYSRLDASGKLSAAKASILEGQYVAGVTKVVVSGKISAVNAAVATAVVNGVVVDYSAVLALGIPGLSVGDVVTFTGTLPQAGQQMLASGMVKRGE